MVVAAMVVMAAEALGASVAGVTKVVATGKEIAISVEGRGKFAVVELEPYEGAEVAVSKAALVGRNFEVTRKHLIPRLDGARDRIYSGFVAVRMAKGHEPEVVGGVRYVEDFQGVSNNREAFPVAASKKGLQVQMVEDAIAVGVKHAAVNFNLSALIRTRPGPETETRVMDGQEYYFNRRYLESLGVKRLTAAGVQVTLIVLCYLGNAETDGFMKHPLCVAAPPNHLTAFNTATAEGLRYFKAALEFVADYFSRADGANGKVWGYIIGNEVNTHWEWYNLGDVERDVVVGDYLRTVRIANTAVKQSSASARVYLSLTHFWTGIYQNNPKHACAGKELVDEFNRRAKQGGDFDWHLAYHPYPENLFECRTWLDKKATRDYQTPQITFKNLEVLNDYFKRPELLRNGKPRRIILSEQGFHVSSKPDAETWQAAAYAYAYQKTAHLEGIDSFIYHRHVDNRGEGGLNLGLWTRQPDSVGTPERPRKIYEVFKAADTAEWEQAFEFALPVIGIERWDELGKR